MKHGVVWIAIFCCGFALASKQPSPGNPSRFAVDEAILKGLEYVYHQALSDDTHFAKFGHDYLMCMDGVISRTTNPLVQHRAEDIGRALGRKWKKLFSEVPEDVNASELSHLMFGLFALERMELPFRTLKNELRTAMAHFETSEFLHFDPHDQAPSASFPLPPSNPMHKHVNTEEIVWYMALVNSYVAQKLGLPLGDKKVQFKDVLNHLPSVRPFKNLTDVDNHIEATDILFAIANLVWTLSDYGALRLDSHLLINEHKWLRDHLSVYLASKDVTAVAIVVDALKIFGEGVDDDAHEHPLSLLGTPFGETDPKPLAKSNDAFMHANDIMQQAMNFILSLQKADGSWSDASFGEQERYHPTCAALYALSEHSHDGFGPSIPGVRKILHTEL